MVASTDPRMSMPNAGSTKFARTTYATPSVIMIRKLVISSNPIPFIFFSIWVFSSSGVRVPGAASTLPRRTMMCVLNITIAGETVKAPFCFILTPGIGKCTSLLNGHEGFSRHPPAHGPPVGCPLLLPHVGRGSQRHPSPGRGSLLAGSRRRYHRGHRPHRAPPAPAVSHPIPGMGDGPDPAGGLAQGAAGGPAGPSGRSAQGLTDSAG